VHARAGGTGAGRGRAGARTDNGGGGRGGGGRGRGGGGGGRGGGWSRSEDSWGRGGSTAEERPSRRDDGGVGWQQQPRRDFRRDDDNNNSNTGTSWREQQDGRLARRWGPDDAGEGGRGARGRSSNSSGNGWASGGPPRDSNVKKKKAAAGTPSEAPPPAAATPVGGSGLGGRCYGCGAALQTVLPGTAGYVQPERYETRRRHRQLDTLLCGRCSDLCNGAMVPAVADFSQKAAARGEAAAAATTATAPPALQLRVAAILPVTATAADQQEQGQEQQQQEQQRALVDPSDLREQLLHVRDRRALVVLLADLLDASGTLMPRVRDMVGRNPVVLIGTKLDLLPAGTRPRRVAEWLADSAARRRLTVAATHVISAHTGEGVPQAVARVLRERKGRDVYVVGAANVGKSAFVRAVLREMSTGEGGNFDAAALAHGARLPVESAMPGTTLGLIALRAFESGGTLYDTPGVHLHHRVPHLLSPDELRLLHPRRALAPYVCAVAADSSGGGGGDPGASSSSPSSSSSPLASYVWGGLVRVDVLSAPDDASLAFYGPAAMRVATFAAAGGGGSGGAAMLPPPTAAALDNGGGSTTATTPAERAAAVAAALGAGLAATSATDSTNTNKQQQQWLAAADSVAARGGLTAHDVLVPAPPMVAPSEPGRRPRRDAALADVAVSGVPGWIAVHSPRGRSPVRLRVWAPRGVEVFLRPAIPVPLAPVLAAAAEEDDYENSGGGGKGGKDLAAERRVFGALAEALGEVEGREEGDGGAEGGEGSEAMRVLLGSVVEASASSLAAAAAAAARQQQKGGAGKEEEGAVEADPALAGLDLAALGLEGQEDAVRALLSYGGVFGGGDGEDEDEEEDEEDEEEEDDRAAARPTRRAAAAAPRGRAALAAMRSRRAVGGGGGDKRGSGRAAP
jgi:nitric-oxide synthase